MYYVCGTTAILWRIHTAGKSEIYLGVHACALFFAGHHPHLAAFNNNEGKAFPVQPWTGPEGFRNLMLPGCQP